MTRWIFRITIVVAVFALGFWAWTVFFPGPEQKIRKRLTELAQAASIAPNEAPAARFLNAQRLANFFAQNAEITVDLPGRLVRTFNSRQEITEAATAARAMLSSLKVEFVDITVSVASDKQSADARLTVKANVPGESTPEVEELKIGFTNNAGDWLIHRAETVKILR
ncbi:MAG TPA: hypothetical protein VEC99_00905 [Clostridia bacterium]|nr:hypothetical protein [Clostridia bacterium]